MPADLRLRKERQFRLCALLSRHVPFDLVPDAGLHVPQMLVASRELLQQFTVKMRDFAGLYPIDAISLVDELTKIETRLALSFVEAIDKATGAHLITQDTFDRATLGSPDQRWSCSLYRSSQN
jgi:hypothetical protein